MPSDSCEAAYRDVAAPRLYNLVVAAAAGKVGASAVVRTLRSTAAAGDSPAALMLLHVAEGMRLARYAATGRLGIHVAVLDLEVLVQSVSPHMAQLHVAGKRVFVYAAAIDWLSSCGVNNASALLYSNLPPAIFLTDSRDVASATPSPSCGVCWRWRRRRQCRAVCSCKTPRRRRSGERHHKCVGGSGCGGSLRRRPDDRRREAVLTLLRALCTAVAAVS
jgi:hypothetical protein